MERLLVTGSGGLVGSEVVEYFSDTHEIIGIDNDVRGKLLKDKGASTKWNTDRLEAKYPNFRNFDIDIRSKRPVYEAGIKKQGLKAIIHCAAQASHEGEVREDFSVNVMGTLGLLELWRDHCPDAIFIYLSTIKVYADYPNSLNYLELPTRYDFPELHPHYNGFDEQVSIDQGISSFFGRSKTAADLYVQEFAHQYGLRAAVLRASCITGGNHSGVEAHGMLSYMMKCAVTKTPYSVFGYGGKQVRDQIHAHDVAGAIDTIIYNPPKDIVYNIGGGRENSISIIEAIDACQEVTNNGMLETLKMLPDRRKGDHIWWITDTSKLRRDYGWQPSISVDEMLLNIYYKGKERW